MQIQVVTGLTSEITSINDRVLVMRRMETNDWFLIRKTN